MPIPIRPLSLDEYEATLKHPMTPVEGDANRHLPPDLVAYADEVLAGAVPGKRMTDLNVPSVIDAADGVHRHVLVSLDERNRYLAVILLRPADRIVGHYLVDMNAEFGLSAGADD